jgi:hypothetical protein
VVGKSLMSGRGGLGDDRIGPIMTGHYGLGYVTALGAGQLAGVKEDPESFDGAALPAVGDVLVVLQRRPVARGGGEIPGGAARPGEVEVDQCNGPAMPPPCA